MATKEENREHLQKLKAVIEGKLRGFDTLETGDEAVKDVEKRLLEILSPKKQRKQTSGYDRIMRGGRNRKE
jgi:hypothetical protein